MRRLALIILLAALGWVAWDGYERQEWKKHAAAGGCLAVAMVAVGLLGGGRRKRRRSPEVAGSKVEIKIPEGPLELGHPVALELRVKVPRDLHLDHVVIHLVNRRFEKKAPLDRVVSQSTFLFRWDVGRALKKDEEATVEVPMRTLSCREPTRESKYVSITWEVSPVLHFAAAAGEKVKFVYEGAPVDIEFTGPQNY